MPEPYWPKRKNSYTLMDAHRNRSVIRVACPYDKHERYFMATELRTAFGNVEVDDLMFLMKCSRCGSNVDVSAELMSAEKRQTVTLRRLVDIKYKRLCIWRDEPPS